MKFAVYAALVASSSALTGCKKGIAGKFYTDSKCATESHSSFRFMEKDVKDTGDCKSHHSSEDDNKALATSKKDLKTAKAATEVEAKKLKNLDKITVDDLSVTDKTKERAKQVTAAEAFNAEWPTLKEKYNKWRKSEDAYKKYLDTFKINDERLTVIAYHKKYHDWYELNDALPDTPSTAEKDALDAAKTQMDTAMGHIPKNTDKELIQQEVKDSEDFQKYKTTNVDNKNLTPKCSNDPSPDFVKCTPNT